MPHSGPYVNVKMVDGQTYSLPGTIDEVTQTFQRKGPLVQLDDVFDKPCLINTAHVVHAAQLPDADFE